MIMRARSRAGGLVGVLALLGAVIGCDPAEDSGTGPDAAGGAMPTSPVRDPVRDPVTSSTATTPAVESPEPPAAPGGSKSGESRGARKDVPLPPLPESELPLRTAAPPDPAREQHRREEVVAIEVKETVVPRVGAAYAPEKPIVAPYLAQYFRRAGFVVTDDGSKADFRVTGEFDAAYAEAFEFRDELIALKFEASFSGEVVDSAGASVARIDVPRLISEATVAELVKSSERDEREEKYVVRDIRREMAKLLWAQLFNRVSPFADPEIPALLESLVVDDLEAEEPIHADGIVKKLVARRLTAVPYLLEALTDERAVLVAATYPGLTPLTADRLRVYHLADRALEEIFQKVSRLGLETPDRHRFIVIKGWENEWKRFCPAYRQAPAVKAADGTGDDPTAR